MALPAILLLENEEPFVGVSAGAEGIARGAAVASTFSAGIPDLLTDPAYGGKIVCFTYPHVGTAGVNPDDLQSDGIAAHAVVAREIGKFAANRLGAEAMDVWLAKNGIPAIEGVDTRTIAELACRFGGVRAVVGTGAFADADALAKEFAAPAEAWAVKHTGVTRPTRWTENAPASPGCKVVVYDFGVKRGFLRRLAGLGCELLLVPSGYPADKALAEKPDAIVFSSGAGVPDMRLEAIRAAMQLLGAIPLWGVGVGAGILAAAAGVQMSSNVRNYYGVQPMARAGSLAGEMVSQVTEFRLDKASLAEAGLEVTHANLNDKSVQGYRCAKRKLMGTLFYPEAEPGPRDSLYLFDTFMQMIGK